MSPRTVLLVGLLAGCGGEKAAPDATSDVPQDTGEPLGDLVDDVTSQANGCFSLHLLEDGDPLGWLGVTGTSTTLVDDPAQAARFTFQAADLGEYLLYDHDGLWLSAEDGPLTREAVLDSDVTRLDDAYISGGEWILEPGARRPDRHQLRSRRHGTLLASTGLATDDSLGAQLRLDPAEGCMAPPELAVDATGVPTKTTFDDGTLYGLAEAHAHLLTNYSFGGFLFHGGAFHRLGVEHALGDCSVVHGPEGRHDFFGYAFDEAGNDSAGLTSMVLELSAGELSEPNHMTAGWPEFPDWPNARKRATHQTQYYKWLERAWLGGLRLLVQHATSNSVICELSVGEGIQSSRYDCSDMAAVDRIIDETRAMERYIDAQHGGEGLGWFRIVETPAEARSVVEEGKLAIVLGIETSDLFSCALTPKPGDPVCDEAWVEAELDAYHQRGVRALFPVHKYDNQFSPGDGSDAFIELGNFIHSGHWTNKTEDCPGGDMPTGFDDGKVTFGGLLEPREVYDSEAPNDFTNFEDAPLETIFAFTASILEGSADGDYCQNATITPIGETLIEGMMRRGMILEIDHFPQWSYQRVHEILEANDYPAAGTHGREWGGRLYALGGVSTIRPGVCRDPDRAGATLDHLNERLARLEAAGQHPGIPFVFDYNGFAHGPGPRFGDDGCSTEQTDPVTWPFDSYAGDTTLTQPTLGTRTVDYNTEGMIHIGLLPEYVESLRGDGGDAAVEPLFRGAEAYIRMWEKAEQRGVSISGG